MTENKRQQTVSSRKPLLILFLVFVGPLLLAVLMYFGRDYFPTPESVANGQLINPARPVESVNAKMNNGEEIDREYFENHWHLVLITEGHCDLECEAAMFKMRQARLLTSKDIHRVHMTVITDANTQLDDHFFNIKQRFPKIEHITLEKIGFENDGKAPLELKPGSIYMVDPLGNFMMRYDNEASTKGLLKDLKKVLRISEVG